MKFSIFVVLTLSAGLAHADPGHLIGVAGHDHWLAAGAIGAAIAAGIWGAVKGKRDDNQEEAEAEPETETPQEA